MANLQLSDDDKLDIATKIEGHPDNVAPAIFGNLVVASYVDEHVNSIVTDFPECAFVAFIPSYELKTSDSRGVLPSDLSYKEAVAASSIANVAIAALFAGDLVKAGHAIQGDMFHERYRQKLVKEFATIKELSGQYGAYATYLSGAGPTVMRRLFSSEGISPKSCSICHASAGSSTSTVKYLETATPTESKPGPILADVAGTVIFIIIHQKEESHQRLFSLNTFLIRTSMGLSIS